jgi:hypothetical protein
MDPGFIHKFHLPSQTKWRAPNHVRLGVNPEPNKIQGINPARSVVEEQSPESNVVQEA